MWWLQENVATIHVGTPAIAICYCSRLNSDSTELYFSFQSKEIFLHIEVYLSLPYPRFSKVGIDQKVESFLFPREA